ncbi:DUF6364 family protein [Leucothrix pacifica]|uniref:Antitoxin n=1 Tax=Leucothrix pacifica TaxID=1247513 RepID=A0A317C2D5_9GAMM|nr:DUF6364 family protein [Leucothrix pacifica]PWQ92351.1 antitoxin [Leucothrix pacifica]
MQTKLTLHIDDSLILLAKDYAERNGKSLSQIVEDYFRVLADNQKLLENAPITQSLIGVLSESKVDESD